MFTFYENEQLVLWAPEANDRGFWDMMEVALLEMSKASVGRLFLFNFRPFYFCTF